MKINKLKTIYKFLDEFDSYRTTIDFEKMIDDLSHLQVQINTVQAISNNVLFNDILQFIHEDIQYEIDKAVEKRLLND